MPITINNADNEQKEPEELKNETPPNQNEKIRNVDDNDNNASPQSTTPPLKSQQSSHNETFQVKYKNERKQT